MMRIYGFGICVELESGFLVCTKGGWVCRMLGKGGGWCKVGKMRGRTSMTLSVINLPLPKA